MRNKQQLQPAIKITNPPEKLLKKLRLIPQISLLPKLPEKDDLHEHLRLSAKPAGN